MPGYNFQQEEKHVPIPVSFSCLLHILLLIITFQNSGQFENTESDSEREQKKRFSSYPTEFGIPFTP